MKKLFEKRDNNNELVVQDEDTRALVKCGRIICCVGYAVVMTALSMIFFIEGIVNYVADSQRDRNNPIDWPECLERKHTETFEECQEILLHRYEAAMIGGGLMLTICCIAMIVVSVARCTEHLVDRRQRMRLVDNVNQKQSDSYGSML